jgi:nucleoid-associated protein YgaU
MRPAESLWGIAERELGDGERWREIADLNEG